MELETKHGLVAIYAPTIDGDALAQVIRMANSPLGANAHIRIMPDCHAGTGCTIGTTMKITDKVCPNLVGSDIGCGVTFAKTDVDFKSNLDRLDEVIRKYVPYGANTHKTSKEYKLLYELRCWKKLQPLARERAMTALGTLGGGNHFIEGYEDGQISVHSGSRSIGLAVATYYQKLAETVLNNRAITLQTSPNDNEDKATISSTLSYLEGDNLQDYLFDIKIIQKFADDNRHAILDTIVKNMGGSIQKEINSIHNYIDTENMILRKGAISAQENELLVIPLNMKDGILICRGKGNPEWNFSAPHGAGRLYSRSKAKELFTVEEYAMVMEGIYTTCVGQSTLDEAPFAYKDYKEIMECIEPTVEILQRVKPIYNFKAN